MTTMIWILFTHFVADFIGQIDAMAKRKSTSHKWLALHVAAYTLILNLGLLCIADPLTAAILALGNGAAHYVIDYFTSRAGKKLWDQGKVHEFFCVIGFDQFLHTSILIATLATFGG